MYIYISFHLDLLSMNNVVFLSPYKILTDRQIVEKVSDILWHMRLEPGTKKCF